MFEKALKSIGSFTPPWLTSVFRFKHAAPLSTEEQQIFFKLQLLRAAIIAPLILFLSETIDIGSSVVLLTAGAFTGGWIAGGLVKKGWNLLATIAIHIGIYFLLISALNGANSFLISGTSGPATNDFLIARLQGQIATVGLFYLVGAISTWFFWTSYHFLTLEAVGGASLFIMLLGSHRNFNLDSPKKLSQLAWEFNVTPQLVIIGLTAFFAAAAGLYLMLASNRPLFGYDRPVRSTGPTQRIFQLCGIGALLALLLGYAAYVEQSYTVDISRSSEGVGKGGKEGSSPLGFHSAVGKTKQPAALVRLEGDYSKNPWAPMLYLREGALSEFAGHELVIAAPRYDRDVPRLKPGEVYRAPANPGQPAVSGEERVDVIQSVYLLAEHSAPFAIDYAKEIRLIKNPDPDRFNVTYQAVSSAPTVSVSQLSGEDVGDPDWDDVTRHHYLRAPGSLSSTPIENVNPEAADPVSDDHGEDLRYLALADKITKGLVSPVEKAQAIIKYLSENSIYTRNPGHQANKEGDPVAPYLFADKKRGYCVHFAHAAVYMLRLMGIPSRIATGYLTDLTYAEDGHILLHLGDRHAWPEIYVQGLGWVVADITPAQAENEQALVPDQKLLEELMNKIDPAEIISEPPQTPTPQDETPDRDQESAIDRRNFLLATAALLSLWIGL
jgi:transglutaminase-like putative cysteine protease